VGTPNAVALHRVDRPLSCKCHFRANNALRGRCADRMFWQADGFRTKNEASKS
jgi:hypothetical protein